MFEIPKIPTLDDMMKKVSGGTAVKSPSSELVTKIQRRTAILSKRPPTLINGSISGNILTVESYSFGGIQVGQELLSNAPAPRLPLPFPLPPGYEPPEPYPTPTPGTVITGQIDGFPGEEGTYYVSIPQSLVSTTMKSAIPSDLYSSIDSATTQIDTDLLGFSNGLLTSLPLFGASEKITLKTKVSSGITPAAGPSSDFKTATAPVKDIPAQLEKLAEQLLLLVNFEPAGSAIEVRNEYNTLVTTASTSFAEASAKKNQMIGGLKTFAAVAMMAAPGSTAIAGVLGSILASPALQGGTAELAKAKEDSDKKKLSSISSDPSNAIPSSVTKPVDPDKVKTPLPTTDTPSTFDDNTKTNCIRNGKVLTVGEVKAIWVMETEILKAENLKIKTERLDPNLEKINAWKAENYKNPTYTQLKEKAEGWFSSDSDKKAYIEARAAMRSTPAGSEYDKASALYNSILSSQKTLADTWKEWTDKTGGWLANYNCDVIQYWRDTMPDEFKAYANKTTSSAPIADADPPPSTGTGWRW